MNGIRQCQRARGVRISENRVCFGRESFSDCFTQQHGISLLSNRPKYSCIQIVRLR